MRSRSSRASTVSTDVPSPRRQFLQRNDLQPRDARLQIGEPQELRQRFGNLGSER
jgi:hypothetical protein